MLTSGRLSSHMSSTIPLLPQDDPPVHPAARENLRDNMHQSAPENAPESTPLPR